MRYAVCFLLNIAFLLIMQGCGATLRSGDPAERFALRNLGNGICLDRVNGKMWQVEASGPFLSWEQAKQYADALTLGGYTDWHLPSRGELYDLHDLLALKMAGDCVIQEHGGYWSTTSPQSGDAGYWDTYPLCGDFTYAYIKTATGAVRAVRP
jgi:hypothetical protein